MLDIHINLQEASPNDWLALIMKDWRSVNGRLLLEYLLFIQNIYILFQNIELARFRNDLRSAGGVDVADWETW